MLQATNRVFLRFHKLWLKGEYANILAISMEDMDGWRQAYLLPSLLFTSELVSAVSHLHEAFSANRKLLVAPGEKLLGKELNAYEYSGMYDISTTFPLPSPDFI